MLDEEYCPGEIIEHRLPEVTFSLSDITIVEKQEEPL
jgi:hypothetical protein